MKGAIPNRIQTHMCWISNEFRNSWPAFACAVCFKWFSWRYIDLTPTAIFWHYLLLSCFERGLLYSAGINFAANPPDTLPFVKLCILYRDGKYQKHLWFRFGLTKHPEVQMLIGTVILSPACDSGLEISWKQAAVSSLLPTHYPPPPFVFFVFKISGSSPSDPGQKNICDNSRLETRSDNNHLPEVLEPPKSLAQNFWENGFRRPLFLWTSSSFARLLGLDYVCKVRGGGEANVLVWSNAPKEC